MQTLKEDDVALSILSIDPGLDPSIHGLSKKAVDAHMASRTPGGARRRKNQFRLYVLRRDLQIE